MFTGFQLVGLVDKVEQILENIIKLGELRRKHDYF